MPEDISDLASPIEEQSDISDIASSIEDIEPPKINKKSFGRKALEQIPSGFNKVIFEALSTPSRAADELHGINKTIISKLPFIGGEKVKQAAEEDFKRANLPLKDYWPTVHDWFIEEPTDRSERILSSGGEFLGEATKALLPLGTVNKGLNATEQVIKAAPEVVKGRLPKIIDAVKNTPAAVKNYMDDITRNFAEKPLATSAVEIGSNIGAGFGEQIAEESGGGEGSQFIGGLTGGFLGGGGLTSAMYRPTQKFIKFQMSRFSPEAREAAAKEYAAQHFGSINTPEAQGGLAEAERLKEKIPGFNPTLAEATDMPSAKTFQQDFEGRAEGVDLDQLVKRREDSLTSIKDYADNKFGALNFDRELEDLNKLREPLLQKRENKLGEFQEKRQDYAESRLPAADRTDTGSRLRDRYFDLRTEKSNEMSELAKKLNINTTRRVNIDSLKERFDAIVPKGIFEDRENTPKVIEEVLKTGKDAPVTFKDIKQLRERLGQEIRDTLGDSKPNSKKLSNLYAAKSQLDEFMEFDLPRNMPKTAENYKKFLKAYRDEYIIPFENNDVYKIRKGDKQGDYITRDERIADIFFKKGDITAARQYKQTFKNDPYAFEALKDSILDKARERVVKDGVIDPKAMDKWLKDHDSVLNEFPAIKRYFNNTQSATKEMADRAARLEERKAMIDKNFFNSIVGKNSEQVVNNALKDKKLMRKLQLATKSNPDALRKAVWDRAMKEGNRMPDFIEQNKIPMMRALGKDHYNDLLDVSKAFQMMERVRAPEGAAIEINPYSKIEKTVGTSIPSMYARARSVNMGKAGADFMAAELFQRYSIGASKRKAETIMKEMLYKPELASDMANYVRTNGKNRQAYRRLNSYLMSIGLNPMTEGSQNEKESNKQSKQQ